MIEALNNNNSKKGGASTSNRAKNSRTVAPIYQSYDARAKINKNSSRKNYFFPGEN